MSFVRHRNKGRPWLPTVTEQDPTPRRWGEACKKNIARGGIPSLTSPQCPQKLRPPSATSSRKGDLRHTRPRKEKKRRAKKPATPTCRCLSKRAAKGINLLSHPSVYICSTRRRKISCAILHSSKKTSPRGLRMRKLSEVLPSQKDGTLPGMFSMGGSCQLQVPRTREVDGAENQRRRIQNEGGGK